MKRGRPKQFDGTPVSVRLPVDLHDALSVLSLQRRVDLSAVIRQALRYYVSQKVQAQTAPA